MYNVKITASVFPQHAKWCVISELRNNILNIFHKKVIWLGEGRDRETISGHEIEV
jgi:hypothetical protein